MQRFSSSLSQQLLRQKLAIPDALVTAASQFGSPMLSNLLSDPCLLSYVRSTVNAISVQKALYRRLRRKIINEYVFTMLPE